MIKNCFLLMLLFFVYQNSYGFIDITKINFEYLYRNDAPIKFRHAMAHHEGEAVLYLRLEYNAAILKDYKLSLSFYENYGKKQSDHVIEIAQRDALPESDGNTQYFKLSFPITAGENLGILAVEGGTDEGSYYYDIPIHGLHIFPRSDLFFMEEARDIPLFDHYLEDGNAFRIMSLTDSREEIYLFKYRDDFAPALPPMSTGSAVARDLAIDSTVVVRPGDIITGLPQALYFAQSDSAGLEGNSLRITPIYYPQFVNAEQLSGPFRFISTSQEYNALQEAEDKKQALDRYLLQVAKDQERAKKIVKGYFRNIYNANHHFTHYKEGWKTDQGMIATVFGLPDEVYKTPLEEIWIYDKSQNKSKIRFTFVKVKSFFTEHHLELVRSKSYEQNWYRTVDLWRKGRFQI